MLKIRKTKSISKIKRNAIFLLIVFGLISLFGDIIYEGARSINGPYLSVLGANAAIIGLVIGLSELLGYVLRLISGYISDKTKSYWLFTILGYGLLISIPLLSLSSIWQIAAILIILERIGKGLRSPARDTIVSYAAKQVGTGKSFGFLELLDQIGATLGPMVLALFFFSLGEGVRNIKDYQFAYSFFWIPFITLMLLLTLTYIRVKNPQKLEKRKDRILKNNNHLFKNYIIFSFLTTLGFVNFAIIGYHLKFNRIVEDAFIPLLYALAMIVDAIFGLVIGILYDKMKNKKLYSEFKILVSLPIATTISLPLVFSSNTFAIFLGIFLWGFVLGAHETIMKAVIADITTKSKRAFSYGRFNIIYGLAIFIGSSLTGYLYEISVSLLILVALAFEILSLIVFGKILLIIRTEEK